MSQEVRTNPSLDEIDEPASTRAEADPIDLLGDGSFPMDSYANRLMDELFGEVDRLFEGGSLPAEPPVTEAVVSLQPIAIPQLEVPDLAPVALAPIGLDGQIATSDEEAIATLEPATEPSSVNRWLLAALFASAIAAGVSWLVFFRPAAPPAQSPQTAQPSQADQQFASYVQRSLDRIAGRAQPTPAAATAASPALPNVALPSSAPNAAPSAPDRVYVPVYQPPQTLYPPVGVSPVVPPVPPVAVSPAAPTAPRPVTVPAVPRSAAPAAPVAAAPVAAAPVPQQTLMGLMQFGDRSAALFEVNGSPQRISVGETIGSSGWTLVSVSNDAAVIRRNGEVRSIYVGQQF